jgi:hypothetical protein
MTSDGHVPSTSTSSKELSEFLRKVAETPRNTAPGTRGRLIFAMDATASREPSWDRAAQIQGEMFSATAALGGLDLQLAFYRGFGEYKTSSWVSDSRELMRLMTSVFCLAGQTQIRKVLKHAANETRTKRVNALVFVGDCMEEDVDTLGHLAGELGVLGVPAFMFQEGEDPVASFSFKQIAKLSGGAYCRFDSSSAGVLKELLGAVAVFAAGGRPALENFAKKHGGDVLRIADQMKRR